MAGERVPVNTALGRFILAVILTAFGVVSYVWSQQDADYADAHSWPTVVGVIDGPGHIEQAPSRRGTRYTPRVSYSYDVDGQRYTADRIEANTTPDDYPRDEAQAMVDRYASGERVNVYYDPDRPHRAVLDPGSEGLVRLRSWASAGVVLFPVLGWGFVIFGAVRDSRRGKPAAPRRPAPMR